MHLTVLFFLNFARTDLNQYCVLLDPFTSEPIRLDNDKFNMAANKCIIQELIIWHSREIVYITNSYHRKHVLLQGRCIWRMAANYREPIRPYCRNRGRFRSKLVWRNRSQSERASWCKQIIITLHSLYTYISLCKYHTIKFVSLRVNYPFVLNNILYLINTDKI